MGCYDVLQGLVAPPPSPAQERISAWHSAAEFRRWGSLPAALFHGTASDLAFLILQQGLRNMSGTGAATNGAIFGKGIYVTDSRAVAEEFTKSAGDTLAFTRNGTEWLRSGERDVADGSNNSSASIATRRSQLLPLLHVEVVASPSNRVVKDGKEVAKTVPVSTDANGKPALHMPVGAYLVVDTEALVRIVRIEIGDAEVGFGTGHAFKEHHRCPANAYPQKEHSASVTSKRTQPTDFLRKALIRGAVLVICLAIFSAYLSKHDGRRRS
jgi:hypothetical protein